jgi:hypothetical protein
MKGGIMEESRIEKKEGKNGARVDIDRYEINLMTTRNGYHWSGGPINRELAKLVINVLQDFLELDY